MVGETGELSMSRKNKVRYRSKGNQYPVLILTGHILVRHRDEEEMALVQRGDLQLYLSTDGLPGSEHGDYDAMGHEGYLKADVFDGKGWKPLSLEEFFPGREYYFGKRERPLDTCHFCMPMLKAAAGATLMRTYREHYVKTENPED
jgi:hypothetical protein